MSISTVIQGYWGWTWSQGQLPDDATLSIAFSGWSDPKTALSDSSNELSKLTGERYLGLGGGNKNGSFNKNVLNDILTFINQGQFDDYDGLAFDVEECDAGLESQFGQAFKAAKQRDLKVLVTVSHAAPYACDDAKELMTAFFSDGNIDYLSPQLYTTGKEKENDYTVNPSLGVDWKDYASSKAAIIPSIVKASYYQSAVDYFEQQDVNIVGYVQWEQIT
ncbi:hypothetical protein [Aliikangiella coralliicola]|uniref:GH18 domain-containing protein n=1 Tax=Aliikangiella coralliicola TaxID=2592383 RepID=A0A545UBK7_9GAMM|nr:hypothetical protein [Aliikangiella coralliicola]TQV86851.1 hypothetical protein FLL46_13615 [Aliikangiella coralliicola]